jgi:hypothetical protein
VKVRGFGFIDWLHERAVTEVLWTEPPFSPLISTGKTALKSSDPVQLFVLVKRLHVDVIRREHLHALNGVGQRVRRPRANV